MWNRSNSFTSTYKLDVRNGHPITVADMSEAISHAIQFIKAHDVNQEKYKLALEVLKLCQLRFMNKQTRKPNKREWHSLIDVIHEMEDMRARSDADRKENEKIALALDLLIDMSPGE